MSSLVQILAAFATVAGSILAGYRFMQRQWTLSRDLRSKQGEIEAGERTIRTLLGRYRETHRRLLLQLEQAEIYFEIEQELAEGLAAAQGGKAVTKKSRARAAVMDRRRGDVELITRVTTPSGIRDLRHRTNEMMLETMELDLPGISGASPLRESIPTADLPAVSRVGCLSAA